LPFYQGAMVNLFDFSQKAWIGGLVGRPSSFGR
jgi:hypothetical protein